MKKARGTDEHPARPRMTGTVIRTFGRAESFKVKSLFGTDERLARPRMTGTVIRTSEVSPRMTGTVIRTFESAGTSWGFFDKLLMQKGQKP